MNNTEQIAGEMRPETCGCCAAGTQMAGHIRQLQAVTMVWMLVECAVALAAAWRARSPVLLAFGADSVIELMSATVVILQFVPRLTISEARAQTAGILLFALAGIVTFTSVFALWQGVRPETSWIGITIAVAALFMMPVLSRAKRAPLNHRQPCSRRGRGAICNLCLPGSGNACRPGPECSVSCSMD